MSQPDRPVRDTRVTASPGTPEYQRQVDRQALAAADAAIRMGLVRVICGFFGLFFLVDCVMGIAAGVHDASAIIPAAVMAVEPLSVAIRGKSVYLRFLLSGVRRPESREGSD